MDTRPISVRWIDNSLQPEERERFLEIHRTDASAADGPIVDRALPLTVTREAQDAAQLFEAITGYPLVHRIFANHQRVYAQSASEESLLPDGSSRVAAFLKTLPSVQALIDAWCNSVVNPSDQTRDALLAAEAAFEPDELSRLKTAILAIAKSKRKHLEFGMLDGDQTRLHIPPKSQLMPVKPVVSEPVETDEHVIASINYVSFLTNAAGALFLVPTATVGADVAPGTTVQLINAHAPMKMRWRSVDRVNSPKKKTKKSG